ncbi:MAG: nucleoside hydrolase [Bryobacterales bacterium]|nr:nucleoside hydrolase [Bryobacterales bacterium]
MLRRFLLCLCCAVAAAGAPVPVLFDTDMGNDIDDALALAMLHSLESRGEAKLLAVTLTKDHPHAAVYVDLVNHFYGRPRIPVGVVRDGKTPEASPMISAPVERRDTAGRPVYPRRLASGRDADEAVQLLRRILAAADDRSVVFVQVGFSTNLARLLASTPDAASRLGGRDLVARKARLLSIMAGAFPGKPEYNVRVDVPSARTVFDEWPTPIIVSGFEIGREILYPAASIERDFAYVLHHPVADAYRAYRKMPYDRTTWDLTSVLVAVRPDGEYFSLSATGRVRVDDDGTTHFAPGAGSHRYLTADAAQRAKALAAMVELASQPPGH